MIAGMPVTDDHIHIDPVNGRGIEAAKDFRRAGGTHLFLVTKPSWSGGITPVTGEEYREVYARTLAIAEEVRAVGLAVYVIMGVHPAEITRLAERMSLAEAEAVMCRGIEIAAGFVKRGDAVALKSGRPHYPVDTDVWDASNRVLAFALDMARDAGCALQIHAESGPCSDIPYLARKAGIPTFRVVKHYASPETPLTPSMIATSDAIPEMAREGRLFTMESDYMDESSRPGAVIGPKSVPRITRKLLESGAITVEDAERIHRITPEKVYGVEIEV
jgi:TatD-related deoxyribonuclease